MASISCPKCGKPIDLNSNFCSNCGFDIQTFYSNVDSLYNYGLQYVNSNPINSYYAFNRASELDHAPSSYQLGILLFRKYDIFPKVDIVGRKKIYEHCLVQSALNHYTKAENELFQIRPYLITREAFNYIRSLKGKFNVKKVSKKKFAENVIKEIEHKQAYERAIEELNKLGYKFKKLQKPYYLVSIIVNKIYEKCLDYDENILNKTDFYNLIKLALNDIINDELLVLEFNSKLKELEFKKTNHKIISQLFSEYQKLPQYLQKDIYNRDELINAYNK